MHRNIKNIASLLFIAIVALTSCGDGKYHDQILLAEQLVSRNSDSCVRVLDAIPVEQLNAEDEALYNLIHSWLLYRQYAKVIPEEPLEQAFQYYRDSKNPLRRAQVFFLHSVINQDQQRGQASQWMEDLYSACLAIEQTDDYLLASQIYQNYGLKFSEVQQFDEASLWIDKFVDAAQRCGNCGEYVQSLIIKANNCLYMEEARIKQKYQTVDAYEVSQYADYGEAFSTIYKALAIAQEHQMDIEKGRIYTQLALYHSRCQHLDSLLYYARLSTQLNEQLYAQGRRKQLTHYVHLADAHRKLGNADSAIYYARKTFDTPEMPLRNKREAARIIYNTYSELKGDYQSSLEWMRICNRLNDSINKATIASNIEAVQEAAVSELEKSALRKENKYTLGWLIWSMIVAVVVIVLILCRMFSNRRRYHQHLQKLESEFNQKITEMRMQGIKLEQPKAELGNKIVLTGSTREQIEVDVTSILFLSSESNYVKVLHLDADGKVQSKMIRQTMGNIEEQLNDFPFIIRCHRAFIVNLQHVSHATTSSSGLQLTLDASSLLVPVSKTYISLVKASLG